MPTTRELLRSAVTDPKQQQSLILHMTNIRSLNVDAHKEFMDSVPQSVLKDTMMTYLVPVYDPPHNGTYHPATLAIIDALSQVADLLKAPCISVFGRNLSYDNMKYALQTCSGQTMDEAWEIVDWLKNTADLYERYHISHTQSKLLSPTDECRTECASTSCCVYHSTQKATGTDLCTLEEYAKRAPCEFMRPSPLNDLIVPVCVGNNTDAIYPGLLTTKLYAWVAEVTSQDSYLDTDRLYQCITTETLRYEINHMTEKAHQLYPQL